MSTTYSRKHFKRRAFIIWIPLFALGFAANILTAQPLNGAQILGTAVMVIAGLCLVNDKLNTDKAEGETL